MFQSLLHIALVATVSSTPVAFAQTMAGATIRTVRIAGQVMDSVHGTIANAAVGLKLVGATENVAATTTDSNGRFLFPAVIPGSYLLRCIASGFESFEMRITADEDLERTNIVLTVASLNRGWETPYNVSPIGQTLDAAPKPLAVNLCELLKTPDRFNGLLVKIRAEFVSKFQWEGLSEEEYRAAHRPGPMCEPGMPRIK